MYSTYIHTRTKLPTYLLYDVANAAPAAIIFLFFSRFLSQAKEPIATTDNHRTTYFILTHSHLSSTTN